MRYSLNRQKGVTMIEVLLAMGISAVLLVGIMKLINMGQSQLREQLEAEKFDVFNTAAKDYFLAYRKDMLKEMRGKQVQRERCLLRVDEEGEGGISSLVRPAQTPVAAEYFTCAFDASVLQAELMLPRNFDQTAIQGGQLVAILREVYSQDDRPTGAVEMLTVVAQGRADASQRRYESNLSVAAKLGYAGGVAPDRDRGTCAPPDVCGNGWKTDLGHFLNSTELGEYQAQLRY